MDKIVDRPGVIHPSFSLLSLLTNAKNNIKKGKNIMYIKQETKKQFAIRHDHIWLHLTRELLFEDVRLILIVSLKYFFRCR